MQYFRNAPRRSSDVFPLCREGREEGGNDARREPCGCGAQRNEMNGSHGKEDLARDCAERKNPCGCGGNPRKNDSDTWCRDREPDVKGKTCECDTRPSESASECRGDSRREECGCDGRRLGRNHRADEYNNENACCSRERPSSRCENTVCAGLAMAKVSDHEFCELNDHETALCRGTLFTQLDMPFCGQRRKL